MNPLFVLDANVFIDAHRRYYGLDLCPGFWACLRHYSEQQQIVSIDRVRVELLAVNDNISREALHDRDGFRGDHESGGTEAA